MHDLVIRNARIVDGTGAPSYHGAVGVKDGRIRQVGTDVEKGTEEIDAQGLALSPGIIDSHTHYDAQVTWDPFCTPSVPLGVSTVVMGNCGFTIAPCRPDDRERTLRNLTQVEGMSLDALMEGTKWGFQTYPEYLDFLTKQGVGPNVACYAGHSSIRTWVMGEDATEREATDEEIAQMKQVLREELETGAIGFATSTFEMHNGAGGKPMPSRLADDREMRALVTTLGEVNKGLFMLTKGQSTTIPYLESLAKDSGRPVMVAAMQYDSSQPNRVFDEVEEIRAARERGNLMYAQVAATPVTFDFKLNAAYLFEGNPTWKQAIPLYHDPEALKELYARTDFREGVKKELMGTGRLNQFSNQWHTMEIIEAARPEHKKYELKTVDELAKAEGKHPLDWLLDFGIAENFESVFSVQVLNNDEDAVLKLLQDPASSIALSDAGAHLTLFCDAGFGLHMLGRYVRERGDFTLEEAVRLVTSQQAAVYGLSGRGRIAPGCHADLLLFDPDTVHRGAKSQLRDLPAGATRLTTPAQGLHGLWVNGGRVLDDKGALMQDAKPSGHVLREFSN